MRIEKACGVRLVTCPWQALRDPYVGLVMQSHRWFKAEQLGAKWGGDDRIPAAIARGVEVYDAALNAVLVHDERERQKREAAEHERRMAEASQKRSPFASTRPRIPTRRTR